MTGVTYRELAYWVRTGLIRPSATEPDTRGWHFFVFDDLVRIKTVKKLREDGASLQHIRGALRRLHSLHDDPLRECRLIVFRGSVHFHDTNDQVVRRVLDGQEAFTRLALRDLADQLVDAIIDRPELGRLDIITRGMAIDDGLRGEAV